MQRTRNVGLNPNVMALPIPSLADLATHRAHSFRTQATAQPAIQAACAANADLATFEVLGQSEEGRPMYGVVLGRGPRRISLIAGAHADEPVGPETLRLFILEGLRQRDSLKALFEAFRFVVVPHINPDGEAGNRAWITAWPRLDAYLKDVVRELPGRDLEFGFPAMRIENRLVAAFLRPHAPFSLHMSLHGMGFSEGAMLLIDRHWAGRTQRLRDGFVREVHRRGWNLHDHNRKGEKGFFYIESGFTTTPEGQAMQAHFRALGDEQTARLFHNSSMEFVRSLGGDPLSLVTELPLFVVAPNSRADPGSRRPGQPETYLAFLKSLPQLKLRAARGEVWTELLQPYTMTPLELGQAIQVQLHALQLGLEALPKR